MAAEQDNKVVVRRYFEEVFDGGDLDVADEVFDAEHRVLNPYASEGMCGPDFMKWLAFFSRKIIPNPDVVVEDEIAEGEKVMTRWTLRGTLADDLRALGVYGKVAVSGISISRVIGGKVQETWLRCETYLEEPLESVSQEKFSEWLRGDTPTSEGKASDLGVWPLPGIPGENGGTESKICCVFGMKFCCNEPEPHPLP